MTLEQLKIEIDQLIIDGKGKYPVYFQDKPVSFPVSRVGVGKLVNLNVVILKD